MNLTILSAVFIVAFIATTVHGSASDEKETELKPKSGSSSSKASVEKETEPKPKSGSSTSEDNCKDETDCSRYKDKCNDKLFKGYLTLRCKGTCKNLCKDASDDSDEKEAQPKPKSSSSTSKGCEDKSPTCAKYSCDDKALESYLSMRCKGTCSKFCVATSPNVDKPAEASKPKSSEATECQDKATNCKKYDCDEPLFKSYLSTRCKGTCSKFCVATSPDAENQVEASKPKPSETTGCQDKSTKCTKYDCDDATFKTFLSTFCKGTCSKFCGDKCEDKRSDCKVRDCLDDSKKEENEKNCRKTCFYCD